LNPWEILVRPVLPKEEPRYQKLMQEYHYLGIRKIDGKVPVIIICGYGTPQDQKEALLYGVRDFISKPINTSMIISVINGILEKRIE
jgi:FixJ family two-component response regulator